MFNSLWHHELQHARPPCPSSTHRAYSNSCPLSLWCHPTISSSVIPFSSCPQSFPASGSFLRNKENSAGYGNTRYKDQCLPRYVWDRARKWESLEPGLRSRPFWERKLGLLFGWKVAGSSTCEICLPFALCALLWLLTGCWGKLFTEWCLPGGTPLQN